MIISDTVQRVLALSNELGSMSISPKPRRLSTGASVSPTQSAEDFENEQPLDCSIPQFLLVSDSSKTEGKAFFLRFFKRWLFTEEILGYLDSPSDGCEIDQNELRVSGWSFSSLDNNLSIEILIDDILVGKTTVGVERMDLAKDYPTAKSARNSGFVYDLSVQELSDKSHNLKVIARSKTREKLLGSVTFKTFKGTNSTQGSE